ncbi:MAG TPA: hypothetical protein VML95_04645 [Longimicrobiales bacterium]|nr:hypothetical protein [Longimicrobiales bacterium]
MASDPAQRRARIRGSVSDAHPGDELAVARVAAERLDHGVGTQFEKQERVARFERPYGV